MIDERKIIIHQEVIKKRNITSYIDINRKRDLKSESFPWELLEKKKSQTE